MAKKVETIVTLTDDLDGSKADRTVQFAVDGKTYEIDLSKKNANAFQKLLQPYVDAARTVRGTRGGTARTKAKASFDRAELIEWAKGQGIKVAERGRIAQDVVNQFLASK